jgi:hypothetical protein
MGRIAEMILGVIGGIFGVLFGIFAVIVGEIAKVVTGGIVGVILSGLGVSYTPMASSLGSIAVILGIFGIVGGAIVDKNKNVAGGLMLACSIIGFIALSVFWFVPGLLLLIGGLLTFLTKEETVTHVNG